MKKIIAIVIAIVAMLSVLMVGYRMGAMDAMESAVINEVSDYHYSIIYFDNECEYFYSK